jgi:DNA polymerase III subunit delta
MIKTMTGSNSFALQQVLHKLTTNFVKEHGDLALEKLDGEEVEFERLREAMTSLPFLASKKLVILRQPSAQKQFTEKFEELLPQVPETTDVVIIEPKLDKRLGYAKILQKKTEYQEFNELDSFGLSKWLVEMAQEQGGTLSSSDARYLVERVGANQQLLASELEKLILFDPKITRRTIDEMVERTPQSTVFELLDAAFHGNKRRVLELYQEQRLLKVEPQAMLAMIAWQLHVLALVKTAGKRSPTDIAKEAKLNPFVVQKALALTKQLTLRDIKNLISRALEIDIKLKSEPINPDEALQTFLVTITK